MQVLMTVEIASRFGVFRPGDIADVPDETARAWQEAGIAGPLSGEAGPDETASVAAPETATEPRTAKPRKVSGE